MAERQESPQVEGQDDHSTPADSTGNIDQFLSDAWEPHVVQGLSAWKQGDLVEGLPMFWAAPAGSDPVIESAHGEIDWEVFETEVAPGWVVILTQTCDIAGSGPGRQQPFIQVSPAFRFTEGYDQSKIDAVARWEVTYLAPLTAPPGDGSWAVDLRISLPASKGILLTRNPASGFATDLDSLNFGEAIASRARRPALDDMLSYELPKSINDLIEQANKNQPEWWQHVEQVRILIHGDRTAPTGVTPVVIEAVRLEPSERKIWRDWQKRTTRKMRPRGVRIFPVQFGNLDSLSARMYKESTPVRIPKLGRAPSW
jgi:hypothetical protein